MNAVVNLDKPRGITSQDAVIKVRRAFGAKKAGHAGTLDPIATGVLLVCLGEATKITGYLSELEKEYEATLKLGERTDTFDAEGKVIEKAKEGFSITREKIEEALRAFRGEIRQTPPMYSALKVSGKPLYKLARRGVTVERAQRAVSIRELSVLNYSPPNLGLRIACSKGTYIRSLAEDLGLALGTGAHVTELRRTRIGDFTAADSATAEELPEGKPSALRSIDRSLAHLRELTLVEGDFKQASHGAAFPPGGVFDDGERLRLKDPLGRLFAIGIFKGGKIEIARILNKP